MRDVARLFSALTILGAVAGTLIIWIAATESETIMQEIGFIVLALAMVIFPYCVSKACKDLGEPEDVSRYYMPPAPVQATRAAAQPPGAEPAHAPAKRENLSELLRTPSYQMKRVEDNQY